MARFESQHRSSAIKHGVERTHRLATDSQSQKTCSRTPTASLGGGPSCRTPNPFPSRSSRHLLRSLLPSSSRRRPSCPCPSWQPLVTWKACYTQEATNTLGPTLRHNAVHVRSVGMQYVSGFWVSHHSLATFAKSSFAPGQRNAGLDM